MNAGTAFERVLAALDSHGARVVSSGDRVRATCPAHDSRGLSLIVSRRDDGAGVHCFTGCATADVATALGLSMADLFDRTDTGLTAPYVPRPRRPAPHPLGDADHWCSRALHRNASKRTPTGWHAVKLSTRLQHHDRATTLAAL